MEFPNLILPLMVPTGTHPRVPLTVILMTPGAHPIRELMPTGFLNPILPLTTPPGTHSRVPLTVILMTLGAHPHGTTPNLQGIPKASEQERRKPGRRLPERNPRKFFVKPVLRKRKLLGKQRGRRSMREYDNLIERKLLEKRLLASTIITTTDPTQYGVNWQRRMISCGKPTSMGVCLEGIRNTTSCMHHV